MKLDELEVQASAVVETGATTNRVRMRKPHRARKPRVSKQPKDPTLAVIRGVINAKVLCISMPPAELAALDDAAKSRGMNRSAFLRAAARALIASKLP